MNWRLAIEGGPRAVPEGPPAWPLADPAVRDALLAAYADGSWGQYDGVHLERLVERLRALHGVDHVTLCASGTVAVELALRGLGVGQGDEVILAGYDYPGNFRAIEIVGARPVLVDVDPGTWSLDVGRVASARSARTRAIIVSHLHGGLAPMRPLAELARRYAIGVVEDACQMPGAEVDGRVAGSWGDVGVLSFGGSKLLTAGRGGAVVTRRAEIHQRIKIHAQRGNSAFPLSQLQAAVLLPQLDRLAERNIRRAAAARRIVERTAHLPQLHPIENRVPGTAGYYKLAWRLESAGGRPVDRDRFIAAVRAEGVAMGAGFPGFARRSARRCRRSGSLDASTAAANQTVLLHHPVLLQPIAVIDHVATAIEKVVTLVTVEPSGSDR